MQVLLLLFVVQFCWGSPTLEQDVEDAVEFLDYFSVKPHTKNEIENVKAKLNISNHDQNSDEYLLTAQIIKKYGYPVEEHFVTTKDGYILRMQRIPPTRPGAPANGRTVFLMHGILMTSFDWIFLGPDKALAYYLSDLGYDVWMGNARGNSQSRNHTKLTPKQKKFWNFSFHEIATIDLPAMIDHVLSITKQKALYHVGHSQGTTTFYLMLAELPHYNRKILAHYSLAPIVYMSHTFSPLLRIAAGIYRFLSVATTVLNINDFLPHFRIFDAVADYVCAESKIEEALCKDTMFLITGFDGRAFNDSLMPAFLGHNPGGCSMKQLYHYAQFINTGKIRRYDYFPFNALHYGPLHPIHPPSYNIKNVRVPVYLYYGLNDWMVDHRDAEQLCKNLGKNCKSIVALEDDKFNHLDYVSHIHAREMLYDKICVSLEENHALMEMENDANNNL